MGLLPLAISWFGLVGVNREALFDQTLNTHALAARTAADRVEAFLDTRLSLARGMAANRALADPRSPAAQELLAGSLQAWADLDIQAVAVVNAQGEEVVRAQLKGAPPEVAAALRLPAAGAVRRGSIAVPGAGAPAIRISAPLPGGAGTVVLVAGGSGLAGLTHPEELGGEAELAVADRGGRVVVGDARSLSPFPKGLIDAALAGRVAGAGRFRGRRGRGGPRRLRAGGDGGLGRAVEPAGAGGGGGRRAAAVAVGPGVRRGAAAHRPAPGGGLGRRGAADPRSRAGAAGAGEGGAGARRAATRSTISARASRPCAAASPSGGRSTTSSSAATRSSSCWRPAAWAPSSAAWTPGSSARSP